MSGIHRTPSGTKSARQMTGSKGALTDRYINQSGEVQDWNKAVEQKKLEKQQRKFSNKVSIVRPAHRK